MVVQEEDVAVLVQDVVQDFECNGKNLLPMVRTRVVLLKERNIKLLSI